MNQFWHLHYSIDQPIHIVVITFSTFVLAFGLLLTAAVLSEQSDAGVKHAQNTLIENSQKGKA